MDVIVKRNYEELKIYISGVIHLHIKLLNLVGFQSWIHGHSEYYIEYTFTDGTKITSAYNNKEKWISVLSAVDNNITSNPNGLLS